MGTNRRFNSNDAIAAGHDYETVTLDSGEVLPECVHPETRERCFTFTTTTDVERAYLRWLEHAAEAAGRCWSCNHPDDRNNREHCYRCWVMHWADQHVMPRDMPDFPGRPRAV